MAVTQVPRTPFRLTVENFHDETSFSVIKAQTEDLSLVVPVGLEGEGTPVPGVWWGKEVRAAPDSRPPPHSPVQASVFVNHLDGHRPQGTPEVILDPWRLHVQVLWRGRRRQTDQSLLGDLRGESLWKQAGQRSALGSPVWPPRPLTDTVAGPLPRLGCLAHGGEALKPLSLLLWLPACLLAARRRPALLPQPSPAQPSLAHPSHSAATGGQRMCIKRWTAGTER